MTRLVSSTCALVLLIYVGSTWIHAIAAQGSADTNQIPSPVLAFVDGMQFRVSEGVGGVGITPTRYVGPQFTLTQITMITEVGAFINHNDRPETEPFQVIIVRSTNGLPDLSRPLGSYLLTSDKDYDVVSYEFASMTLVLKPGTYFALFGPSASAPGFILSTALDGVYQAGTVTLGIADPTGLTPAAVSIGLAAVTVRGKPIAD